MRFIALLLSIPLLSVALLPGVLQAQTLPSIEELTLTVSPQYPRPYDTVTATVSSNQLDLAAGAITISVNGTVVSEGERSATFTLGGPGTKATIVATVKDAAGTHSATRVLSSADVALVQEASSTVPPFYKGGKLPASQGTVRLIALTNFQTAAGTQIAPQNLSFTWKLGDQVLMSDSGLGKNVLTAVAPVRYRDARVSVTISTQDKSLSAQASTLVSPVDPIMRIYRHDPLQGIDLSRALSGIFAMTNDEETFRAVPYYYASPPTLGWSLNSADSGSNPDITVRTTGSTKGSALLGARAAAAGVTNNAEARLTVQFGENRSTGLFGL